ncbi:Adipocyte plasma membrane-associated protein [Sarcoptes scabiei]|uniref:Adipocyte plasma membrane-associated protein n=1 Tax=Sarcoptes scabiei TaxID=52283 RepID=A0A834VI94_SARSC|nr:Adipocyte plasma membrane-associated protein [Sarcoptes scabiei]UXI18109.1 hypothetical protein NH340_JMT04052 [Sarcoptes scabiei]
MQIKNVFSSLYKIIFDTIFYTILFSLFLGLLPESFFSKFDLKPLSFDNDHLNKYRSYSHLKWNNDLVIKSKYIGSDVLHGPESLAEIGDYIYTGTLGGKLMRIHKRNHQIETVLQFKETNRCRKNSFMIDKCSITKMLHLNSIGNAQSLKSDECGRFLGLRENQNILYILEASTGLYRVDLNQKKLHRLSHDANVIEKKPIIFNDFVFDPKHSDLVYISVSTSKRFLDQIVWSIFENDLTGYVFAFNITSGESFRISEGHAMSNGIEIVPQQNAILVCESTRNQLTRIDLDKARSFLRSKQKVLLANELPVFGEMLLGEPDNIRLDPSTGDLYVGIVSWRHSGKHLKDYFAQWPFIKTCVGRTAYALYVFFDYLNSNLISMDSLEKYKNDLFTGHFIYNLMPEKDGAIARISSKTGRIVKIYGSDKFFGVSEAITDHEGNLWFGSFRNSFVGLISQKNL